MPSSRVIEYVEQKHWNGERVSEKSGPHLIVTCPLCGEDRKKGNRPFYLNLRTGLWNTYCCHRAGTLYSLKEKLGDLPKRDLQPLEKKPNKAFAKKLADARRKRNVSQGKLPKVLEIKRAHRRLLDDKESMAWIYKRGLDDETVKHFRLGLKIGRLGAEKSYKWLVIPYFVEDVLVNCKMRNLDDSCSKRDKWRRTKGGESALFNHNEVNSSESARVFITEAEIDAMSAWKMGIRPVAASSLGASGFSDDWLEALAKYDEVYLLYDNDAENDAGEAAGDVGAEKAALQLGTYRSFRMVLPGKDVNECLVQHSPGFDEIEDWIEDAIPYSDSMIESLHSASVRYANKGLSSGLQLPYKSLRDLMGTLRPQEVTILTGDTSIGKTTFCVDLARREARLGVSTLYWPIEGSPRKVVNKIWCQELGGPWKETFTDDKKKFHRMVSTLSGLPFFLYGKGPQRREVVSSVLNYFARRFGGKLVIIDHLHHLIRGQSEDERIAIDNWLTFMCETAKTLDLHMWLIAHPKKPGGHESSKATHEPELSDFKGSSAGYQDPDNYLVIARKRTKGRDSEEETENDFVDTRIIAKKIRDDDGQEGSRMMIFHKPSQSYVENVGKMAQQMISAGVNALPKEEEVDWGFGDPE